MISHITTWIFDLDRTLFGYAELRLPMRFVLSRIDRKNRCTLFAMRFVLSRIDRKNRCTLFAMRFGL
jgi:hypothetical protein